jgi:hypothetical protein
MVENSRMAGGRTVRRHVLYLGEINDTGALHRAARSKRSDEDGQQARQIALRPDVRHPPALNCDVMHVRPSLDDAGATLAKVGLRPPPGAFTPAAPSHTLF